MTAITVVKIINMAITYLQSNGSMELNRETADLIQQTRERVVTDMAVEAQVRADSQEKDGDDDGPWEELHRPWSELDKSSYLQILA